MASNSVDMKSNTLALEVFLVDNLAGMAIQLGECPVCFRNIGRPSLMANGQIRKRRTRPRQHFSHSVVKLRLTRCSYLSTLMESTLTAQRSTRFWIEKQGHPVFQVSCLHKYSIRTYDSMQVNNMLYKLDPSAIFRSSKYLEDLCATPGPDNTLQESSAAAPICLIQVDNPEFEIFLSLAYGRYIMCFLCFQPHAHPWILDPPQLNSGLRAQPHCLCCCVSWSLRVTSCLQGPKNSHLEFSRTGDTIFQQPSWLMLALLMAQSLCSRLDSKD